MAFAFDDAFLTEVRERNNIVSVVGDYVSLKKAGTHYKGLCPFHSEKTPSFTVREDREFFYCFGCQTGGDVITFVRELNGYSFVEAIRHLGERAGMAIPEQTQRRDSGSAPVRRKPRLNRDQKDNYYAVGQVAQRFFVERLQAMEGTACRTYLRGRGITGEACTHSGLGFAPDRWDGLVEMLKSAGASLEIAETLGLIVKRGGGDGYYDRFRNRLMFPIRSIGGDVIAFGGRTLSTDKEVAKYVNSPDSPVYQKSDTLFGLHAARQAMRKTGWALLVEGNLDLVRVAQEGITNVIAPMGTALTPAQCRLLLRFAPRVVSLYDGDSAGRAAARKAVQTALSEGLQIAVASLPDGEDPDSYIGKHGRSAIDDLVTHAVAGWEYLVEEIVAETRASSGVAGKVRALDALRPVLDGVRDRRERALYHRQLAHTLSIDEHQLVRLLKDSPRRKDARSATEHPASQHEANQVAPTPPPPPRELEFLKLMILAPESCALYMAHDVGGLLHHPGVSAACETFAAAWESQEAVDVANFINNLTDNSLRERLFRALTDAPAIEEWTDQFDFLEVQLRREVAKRKVDVLRRAERSAFQRSDDVTAAQLQLERIKLERQIEDLRAPQG